MQQWRATGQGSGRENTDLPQTFKAGVCFNQTTSYDASSDNV